MPRPKGKIPSYRLHARSGQAVVTIDGKDRYLGKHDTPESREQYDRLIAEWLAAGRNAAAVAAAAEAAQVDAGPTVSVVLSAFMTHAAAYYKGEDDEDGTNESTCYRYALSVVRRLYGTTMARDFGPRALKAVQAAMVAEGRSRKYVNRQVNRVRHTFKWAVGEELIPPSVIEGLRAVDGLKAGRSAARETQAVRPVAEPHVRQVIAVAGRWIATMLELQMVTGMRSGELVIMRTGDIDRSADVWVYRPGRHKTQHHGHERVVYLGQRAQELVKPFLKLDPNAYLFSPAEADAVRRAVLAAMRTTPLSCGNRAGTNRKERPQKQPGERFTTGSYARAVQAACDRAFPPAQPLSPADLKAWRKRHRFHPHQLRHTAATRFRREFNLDVARTMLGQKSLAIAEVYAEQDHGKAREVARLIG